jgi:hypothetical protein
MFQWKQWWVSSGILVFSSRVVEVGVLVAALLTSRMKSTEIYGAKRMASIILWISTITDKWIKDDGINGWYFVKVDFIVQIYHAVHERGV